MVNKMSTVRLVISFVAITMLMKSTLAVDHTVGAPNGGWDTTTNLQSWSSSPTFSVGDNIVFRYTPNHNVLEVTKADYDSCQTSNPIQTDALTPTTIPLTAVGSRYFICGTPGHCNQGMKVEITTVAAFGPPPTTTPSAPSPPTATTPSTPSPPSSSTPPPSVSTPRTPVPSGNTPQPPPSSAETVKMTGVCIMGFGLLMMV